MDQDGYTFIIGRVDDVLNVSGHRIGTAEVESSLVEHPLVTYVFSATRESSFLHAFEQRGLEPDVVFTAWDADVIKTYVRMGLGVGIVAPMAVTEDDLDDLDMICGKDLFPTVTTWIGLPRDRALRRYMLDFVEYLTPHWPRHSIERAATADSQEAVDELAADIALPTLSGCGDDASAVT